MTNVVLPPSFSKEPNNLDFDWVPCPTRGSVWSNAELVDAYGDNIIHPVVVAPFTVLCPEPNNRTRHSTLGLRVVPLADVTYKFNLAGLGYEKALLFITKMQEAEEADTAKAVAQAASPREADNPTDDASCQGKANDKCRVKTSNPEGGSMSPGGTGTEASTVVAAIEGEDADDMVAREDNNSPPPKQDDNLTLNEVREMLFSLMRKSTILNECRERVGRAITKSVTARAIELYKPFTGYISDIASEVNAWRTEVLLIHPKMIDCDYNTYHRYSAQIREKTNGFYQWAHALGKTLDHCVATNRSSEGESSKMSKSR